MEKDKKNDMVIGGRLRGTFGVHGDLKLDVYPPKFKMPDKVYIKDKEGNFKPLEIHSYSKKKGLIKFKNYEDKEKAKQLTNQYFYVSKEILPELGKDEYYEYQLLDADVEFNGKVIGKVVKVDDRLSTPYLLIKCSDDKVRHLPFISEFVKEVKPEEGKIVITPPEGWFSL